MTTAKGGLEGVVATSSSICYIDGQQGLLSYCGYDIHDLAREATFEEVCSLLWRRRLPTRAELGDLRSDLAVGRPLPEAMRRLMRTLPPGDAMDALRTRGPAPPCRIRTPRTAPRCVSPRRWEAWLPPGAAWRPAAVRSIPIRRSTTPRTSC